MTIQTAVLIETLVALGADGIELEDAAGLLTPERTRSLVSAIKGAAGDLPVALPRARTATGAAPARGADTADVLRELGLPC